MDNKWLLSEEQIGKVLDQYAESVAVDGRFSPKSHINTIKSILEPLIRADEAKKCKDWKSPAEVAELLELKPEIIEDIKAAERKKYEGYKSPEEYDKLCKLMDLTLNVVDQKVKDEHARTLRAVGEYLRRKGWFNPSGYETHLDDIDTLEYGQEPEGMDR